MQTPRPSERTLLFILGSLIAFGPLSIDMYLSSFPAIASDFGVPVATIQQSLAAFFIGLALGQLFYGPLIDRFGRKPPIFVGLILYVTASLICSQANSSHALILGRFIQALGACAGMVASRAAVRDLFNERESARVFSLLMLVMGIAPILAPLLGGFLSQAYGWRSLFYVLAGLSTLCFFAVMLFFPETKGPNPQVKISAALSTYLSIARGRRFLGFSLAGGIAQAGLFAYITGSPFVLINLFHVPAGHYGWIFGANAFGLIGASQLNSRLLKKHKPERLILRSISIMALSGLALLVTAIMGWSLPFLLVPLFIFISCMGTTLPNTIAAALAAEGPRAGSASALLGTMQFVCATIASSLVSFFDNGTAIPMAAVIASCAVLSLSFALATLKKIAHPKAH